MLRVLVEAIKIIVKAGLLQDEYSLALLQDLVQVGDGELVAIFQDALA